jgi:hypothetical protein
MVAAAGELDAHGLGAMEDLLGRLHPQLLLLGRHASRHGRLCGRDFASVSVCDKGKDRRDFYASETYDRRTAGFIGPGPCGRRTRKRDDERRNVS